VGVVAALTRQVQLWDTVKCRRVRTMGGHRMRVGTLAWCAHRSVVSSGGRDRLILNRDVRAPNDFYAELRGHKSEVRDVAVGAALSLHGDSPTLTVPTNSYPTRCS